MYLIESLVVVLLEILGVFVEDHGSLLEGGNNERYREAITQPSAAQVNAFAWRYAYWSE